MASATKAPKSDVSEALVNVEAADEYPAADPSKPEAPAAPTPGPEPKPLTIQSLGKGHDFVDFEPANVRPEGEIAAQTTSATGVWVRVRYATGTPGSWQKTAATAQKVFTETRKAKTAAEAVSKLVAL